MPEQKNTTHGPNTVQTKIWHGFDLLVEVKKEELVKMEILVKIKSLVTLILTRISDFDTRKEHCDLNDRWGCDVTETVKV